MFDFLIIGAGFSGAVVAAQMARLGKQVMIVDRRPHIAGNAFDHHNAAGILVHSYGPHIFHTNSADVYNYLSLYTSWRPYEHRVLASVEGQLVPIPINLDTVNRLHGLALQESEMEAYLATLAEPRKQILSSEDVVLSSVGRDLYEKLFRGYTRKQWGIDPSGLDASVAARIPVRFNRDDRYFSDTYQVMPLHGYTRMFENLLDHPNITKALGTDFNSLGTVPFRELVFTGPVDEYFGYCFGKLPYRSLKFEHKTMNRERLQPVAVINHPNEHAYTRVTEFKQLTGQKHPQTSVVYEFPCSEGDPYYPIPRPENAELYRQYEALALSLPKVHFAGRLGTYKYYNMDQVVAQALTLCAKLSGLSRQELLRISTENTLSLTTA